MRILWLKTELLHPVDRGGRIRTYRMLCALRERHHVTYLALDDKQGPADAANRGLEYAHRIRAIPHAFPPRRSLRFLARVAVNVIEREPFSIARFRNAAMSAAIREEAAGGKHDVVVCDFLFPMANVPHDLPLPVVLFQHNVEATIWERMAAAAGNPVTRAYFRAQWQRLRTYERATARRVDALAVVSGVDAQRHAADYGVAGAIVVPTGVDTEFFEAPASAVRAPADLVFLGAMDWLPNEDGIAWFLDTMWPAVQARRPDATLTIVGRNPSDVLRRRAASLHGVSVTGTVDDVRPWLHQGTVMIIPLRIGGGTRLKLYEGQAAGLPVVSTRVGAEGLPVRDGDDILLADEPQAFADAVLRLLEDPTTARRIADRGTERVRRDFSWRAAADHLTTACEAAIDRAASASVPSLPESHV